MKRQRFRRLLEDNPHGRQVHHQDRTRREHRQRDRAEPVRRVGRARLLFSTVSDAVAKGSKVSIPGWLSFERVETSARTGRNPQTGEEIKIPAGQRVKVTAGSKLKAAVK
nr:hypothetical protein GCM10025699_09750 [Microbacterium flavescens]